MDKFVVDFIDKLKSVSGGKNNINAGIIIILLSPILGSILFSIYMIVVGHMISTDRTLDMFWFSCILANISLGMAMVIIGCNKGEK